MFFLDGCGVPGTGQQVWNTIAVRTELLIWWLRSLQHRIGRTSSSSDRSPRNGHTHFRMVKCGNYGCSLQSLHRGLCHPSEKPTRVGARQLASGSAFSRRSAAAVRDSAREMRRVMRTGVKHAVIVATQQEKRVKIPLGIDHQVRASRFDRSWYTTSCSHLLTSC